MEHELMRRKSSAEAKAAVYINEHLAFEVLEPRVTARVPLPSGFHKVSCSLTFPEFASSASAAQCNPPSFADSYTCQAESVRPPFFLAFRVS